jgi:hypothetical protein
MGFSGKVLGARRGLAAVGMVAVVAMAVPTIPLNWDTNPLNPVVLRHHEMCGPKDLPEEGIQGDVPKVDQLSGRAQRGYNCGLELVGHVSLGQDGRPNDNANMAWAGHCAYISSASGISVVPEVPPTRVAGSGVAVVSVTADGKPTYVRTLRSPGALSTAETLNAVTTKDGRSILVIGQSGNDELGARKPMDVYDVSNPDCSKAKLLTTFWWPTNIHNLTISRDGRVVYATLPLQAADISGLFDDDSRTGAKYLGNIEEALEGPPVAVGPIANLDDVLPQPVRAISHPLDSSHEAWPSADGNTLYVGGQTPMFEMLSIIDLSQWLQRDAHGRPKGKPRLISQESGRGHSVRTATIGGRPYLLHSEEGVFGAAYGCLPQETAPFAGPAQPWLTDISDPAHPRTISQFGLQINNPSNCLAQLQAGENDSVHYHDVDDPTDTTFVMASMWNAGLRVFDVRHPDKPAEVAYFNPGDVNRTKKVLLDQAWGHVRYLPESGQIWFATAYGGFWVVRLEPQLRQYLGLDAKLARHGIAPVSLPAGDQGRPGTVHVVLPEQVAAILDTAAWYCTLPALTGGIL